jgi:hypothetical protein
MDKPFASALNGPACHETHEWPATYAAVADARYEKPLDPLEAAEGMADMLRRAAHGLRDQGIGHSQNGPGSPRSFEIRGGVGTVVVGHEMGHEAPRSPAVPSQARSRENRLKPSST